MPDALNPLLYTKVWCALVIDCVVVDEFCAADKDNGVRALCTPILDVSCDRCVQRNDC